MELIHAFMLSVIGFLLIYLRDDKVSEKKRKFFDINLIFAACDFILAGMWIFRFFEG